MENTTLQAIDKLALIIGDSSDKIVEQYIYWHIADAIAWMVVGVILTTFAFKWKITDVCDVMDRQLLSIVKFTGVALGVVFVAANVSSLFAPEAASIHRLIIDISGK